MIKKLSIFIVSIILIITSVYQIFKMFLCGEAESNDWLSCAASNLSSYGRAELIISLGILFFFIFLIVYSTSYLLDKFINKPDSRCKIKKFGQFVVILVGGLSVVIFAFEKQEPILDKNIKDIKDTIFLNLDNIETSNQAFITDNCKIKYDIINGVLELNEQSSKKMLACSYYVHLEEIINSIDTIKNISVTTDESYTNNRSLLDDIKKKLLISYEAHKNKEINGKDSNVIKDVLKVKIEGVIHSFNNLLGMQKKSSEKQALSSLLIVFVFALIFATILELVLTFYNVIKNIIESTMSGIVNFFSKSEKEVTEKPTKDIET